MYDIIGDVHGHASLLKKMLLELGYVKTASGYAHPERKAVFVGDFINRGPQIRKTIRTIRTMVENQHAMTILGNHEINSIISYTKNKQDVFTKNDVSELKTINAFREQPDEWDSHIKWLRTLPLFLELDGIRIVHACWWDEAADFIRTNLPPGKIKKEVFRNLSKNQEAALSRYIWTLVKGLQFTMPGDIKIKNNKGVCPRTFRMRWWEDPAGKTFEQLSFESKYQLPDYTIPPQIVPESLPYPDDAPVVFFGHYCRVNGPHIIKPNICCLDTCINGSKTLLAYRWNGERQLEEANLVRIKK